MIERIKKSLNNFAKWLFKKTTNVKPTSEKQMLYGFEVYENKYLPKNTIYIGTAGKNELQYWAILKPELKIKEEKL